MPKNGGLKSKKKNASKTEAFLQAAALLAQPVPGSILAEPFLFHLNLEILKYQILYS